MKKFLNIILLVIPMLAIGFSFGLGMSKYMKPVYFNEYFALATALICTVVRAIITDGKTRLYTSEEYEKKGEKIFEFENKTTEQ
jgi:hypothetical protein